VTTRSDPDGRPVVIDLLPPAAAAVVYPVGRLDFDAEGLLLLTNDGELANRLTHPRYGVAKTYRARLGAPIGAPEIAALREGVELEDGPTAPARVERLGPREIELELREGRNRQVRRMVEAVGNRVVALRRVGFGSLALGSLPEGRARQLGEGEIARLWKDAEP
jgi:23S rRNA pseudouridine2605 synthase